MLIEDDSCGDRGDQGYDAWGVCGRLIPIEEIEADEDVWEDERNFRRDRLTEDINPVPSYPEPPEYIPPPVYDE